MNSFNQDGGQQPASVCAVTGSGSDQDEMKRQAAEQLIRNYYKQLTDGCGNPDCDNQSCASCPDFSFKSVDRNKLAIQAISLSRQRARLCDGIPEKFAKYPVQETGSSQAMSSGGAGASSSSYLNTTPGGSGLSGSGGAKAKQLPNQNTSSASSSSSSISSKTEINYLDEEKVNSLIRKASPRAVGTV